jgi:hypothetical protein
MRVRIGRPGISNKEKWKKYKRINRDEKYEKTYYLPGFLQPADPAFGLR